VFDVDELVAACEAALAESQPMLAVKEVVERAVADGAAVEAALPGRPGVELLHRSDTLTVASVVLPAELPGSLHHDHRMWAVVGVYGGQEDNQFFRRAEAGLEESGGRSILRGEALAMGSETVHAIRNPSAHDALAAIHVYGGDLVGAHRSMWTVPGYEEQPYDDAVVLQGGRIRGVGEADSP
jgi:predicted metal-dependent enzyme (double-stranded beta helix superfamily)